MNLLRGITTTTHTHGHELKSQGTGNLSTSRRG